MKVTRQREREREKWQRKIQNDKINGLTKKLKPTEGVKRFFLHGLITKTHTER